MESFSLMDVPFIQPAMGLPKGVQGTAHLTFVETLSWTTAGLDNIHGGRWRDEADNILQKCLYDPKKNDDL